MHRVLVAGVLSAIFLTACTETVVSDYNGDSVTVQSMHSSVAADPTAVSEAARICATVGRRAEYASTRQVYAPQSLTATYAHLFLCLGQETPSYSQVPTGAPVATPAPVAPPQAVEAIQPVASAAPASVASPVALPPVTTQTTQMPGHRVAGKGCPGFAPRVLYAESLEKLPKSCESVTPL